MPKYTLRKNGQMLTTIVVTVKYNLTAEQLAEVDGIAKKLGYKNFRHYADQNTHDPMIQLYDDDDFANKHQSQKGINHAKV